MLVLKFPYAIALGLLGGILEFLPGVGRITSAAVFLIIGFLTILADLYLVEGLRIKVNVPFSGPSHLGKGHRKRSLRHLTPRA